MARAPQNISLAPTYHLIIAGVIGVVLFFVGIILSYGGPVTETSTSSSLYDCPGNKHVWSDQCNGTKVLKTYTYELSRLRVTGGYYGCIMQPYYAAAAASDSSKHKLTLHVNVTSWHTDKQGYWTVEGIKARTLNFECKNNGRCEPLIVEHSNKIRNSGKRFKYEFDEKETAAANVGDVIFTVERGNEKRASLVLSFDVIYIVVAFLVFLGFGFSMRNFALSEWSVNQKFTVLLAFGFILYSAPFLSLDYALRSSFLVLIGTILRILFFALLLFYWMLLSDNLLSKEAFSLKDKVQMIRVGALALYIVLSVIAFGWLNISDHRNPVMSQAEGISGVIAFVVLSDIVFVAMLVWIGISIALGIRGSLATSEGLIGYIFQVAPVAVVALSMFIGIFLNNYGVVNHKRSDLFFSTLYVTYVMILAFISFPGVLFSFNFAKNEATVEDDERNEFAKSSKVVDKADEDDEDVSKNLI